MIGTVNRKPYPRMLRSRPGGTGWMPGLIEMPSGRIYYVSPRGPWRRLPDEMLDQIRAMKLSKPPVSAASESPAPEVSHE